MELAAALGAKDPAVACQTARRDLRQIAILVSQDKAAGDGVGATDAAPHAWRDTRAVLGGARVPEERVCVDYVEANVLAGLPDDRLETAAPARPLQPAIIVSIQEPELPCGGVGSSGRLSRRARQEPGSPNCEAGWLHRLRVARALARR